MQTDLRPMSLGEILDRTAQLYRSHFLLFAGISAVYAGTLLTLNLLQIGIVELLRIGHMSKHLPWVTLGFVVIIVPLIFICAGAAIAANNRAVAWVNLDQAATIRDAYAKTLPRIGRYLWLMTLIGFTVYAPFVILFVSYFVLIAVMPGTRGIFTHPSATPNPQAAGAFLVATVVLFLLAVVALVYAVWMALRYSLAVAASVLEDLPARKAMGRSVELSKGSRGRIFVLGLLITAIQMGLVGVSQIIFVILLFKEHGQLPVWIQIVQQLVGFCTTTFIGPMYATGLTLFYYDQRMRKEGLDILWLMEAAGMIAPPAEAGASTLLAAPADSPSSQ